MVDEPFEALPDYLRKAPRSCEDPLKAARELRPVIEAGAAEGARTAVIPDDVMRAITEAGIWGLKVPREFGGSEVDVHTYMKVIEELSYADASTGWTVLAAGFFGGGGVGLGPSARERIYGGDEGILAVGQISALGRCERVDGGYRVWDGQFHFGSGSRYASWFAGRFAVEKDGEPVLDEHGRPTTVFCFTSRDKVRNRGGWDVLGLRATGSYSWEFLDQVVPDDWVAGLPGRPRVGGALQSVGVSSVHGAWAIGAGQRALDEIFALAESKQRFQRTTLIDQNRFQLGYGRHLAALQAARSLLHEVFDAWYEAAAVGRVPIEIRARARMATCWATEVALEAGQFAMFSSGSDGVRNRGGENTLQRVFLDLQTGATHRHVDQEIFIETAQVALGVADEHLEL